MNDNWESRKAADRDWLKAVNPGWLKAADPDWLKAVKQNAKALHNICIKKAILMNLLQGIYKFQ